MTQRSLICTAILATLLGAQRSDASVFGIGRSVGVDDRPRLTLLWHDGYGLAPHFFAATSREVEHIFSEVGVDIYWHDGSHGHRRENRPPNSDEILIVLMPVDSADWGYEGRVMGAAVRNLETPEQTHTVYVFFPNVLRTLGLHTLANVGKWRQVARALGRVLAHEIVHAIAPGHPHQEAGLMGKQLRRSILLKRLLRLDPASARLFARSCRPSRFLGPSPSKSRE